MKLNEAIAEWWLRNACIRHGHPPTDNRVTIPEPKQEPAAMSNAAKIAAALIVGAGGVGAAHYMGWLPGTETQAVVAPADPQPQNDASLYQYLEDNGAHLPLPKQ